MCYAYGVELLFQPFHPDHVHLFVLGEIQDLGEVQGGSEARVEEFVLGPDRTATLSAEETRLRRGFSGMEEWETLRAGTDIGGIDSKVVERLFVHGSTLARIVRDEQDVLACEKVEDM